MTTWTNVDRVNGIGGEEFHREYVIKGRPVVIQGMMSDWPAMQWGLDRFRKFGPPAQLMAKKGNVADGVQERVTLAGYTEALEKYELGRLAGHSDEGPGYLHDVPLFRVFPELVEDVQPFPQTLFPRWYRGNWPEYVQYFMGPSGSVTPLHFDTLLTNNLFFHIAGRKQFTLIPASQRALCYTYGWRWAKFDPTDPDYNSFPLAAQATPISIVLEAGDILYMPPGTLHHVRNLTMTISFNVDWHTTRSARSGLISVFRGAPAKNGYYNLLSLLGLGAHVPEPYIFPFYKSYLTYVS